MPHLPPRTSTSTHRASVLRLPSTNMTVAALSAAAVLAVALGTDALTHAKADVVADPPTVNHHQTSHPNPWPTNHTPGTATPTTISTGAPATTTPPHRPIPTFTSLPTSVPSVPAPAPTVAPTSSTPRPVPTFPTATPSRPTGTAPRPTWPDANKPSLPVPTAVPTATPPPPTKPLPSAPSPSGAATTPPATVQPSMPSVLPDVDA